MALDTRPRILLADDHQLVRMGLRQMLIADGGFVVVAETDSGTQLEALVREHDPDVLVLDLQLRDGSALERIPALLAAAPHLAILVLSMHDQRVYAERCIKLGAKGYLMKEEAAALVVDAIRQVVSGGTFTSPSLGAGSPRGGPPIEQLSDRELQVFELTGDGLPTRAVAARLGLSEKTVEAHKANIKKKLGIEHGTELARLAMAWRETGGATPKA
ncbi:MAG: response regulator transcription factor [Planctomycetes bacterium]|nr:response regulator transcription factor [Planctomycetota bacterium]